MHLVTDVHFIFPLRFVDYSMYSVLCVANIDSLIGLTASNGEVHSGPSLIQTPEMQAPRYNPDPALKCKHLEY